MSLNSWKDLQVLDLFEERGNENSGPEFLSITYAKYLRLLCKNYIPDVDFAFDLSLCNIIVLKWD